MERFEDRKELVRPILASERYNREELEAKARRLIENRQRIEHDKWEREPEINARSGLFEELTAKGHLSVIESEEPIEETNQRTLQRLINGCSDNLPEWEKERRFIEIVEELINHRVSADIRAGILPPDAKVFTISNFPSGAPERAATALGYGVLNDKGMVRSTGFENGVRTVEQVSRSNSNDGSAEQLFMANGFVVGHGATRILSNQIIATKEYFPNGVIDLQRTLDEFAGPNIIYGEDRLQADLNVPEYEDLRTVSTAREQQAQVQIKKLAEFECQLNVRYQTGGMSYEDKLRAINKRRKELVNEICVLDPSYAKDARGEASVFHFEQASLAMAAGNDAAGIQHLENALAVADPRAGAVCGGDGIETLAKIQNNLSAEAKRLYLEAKEDRKNWKWKKGVCVVKECPTRPSKTEVGPCGVCHKCQRIFDNGDNPKFIYKTLGFMDLLIQAWRESSQRWEAEQEQKKVLKMEKTRQAQEQKLRRSA